MFGAARGALLPSNGLSLLSKALSLDSSVLTFCWPKPVPTRPTCVNFPSRFTPTIRERNAPSVVVHPPMTTSCPARHFDLVQSSVLPDTYGASSRFEMMHSREILHADCSTASPAVSK